MACHYNFRCQRPIFSSDGPCQICPTLLENPLSDLEHLLERSSAKETFKTDVRRYFATGRAEHVRVDGFAPQVKVRRLLTHLLASEPSLAVENIVLRARSGCSDFVGTVFVATDGGTRTFEFIWDCRWRAVQEGWVDCFGFPDQIRAAQEFDWRCFQRWAQVATA